MPLESSLYSAVCLYPGCLFELQIRRFCRSRLFLACGFHFEQLRLSSRTEGIFCGVRHFGGARIFGHGINLFVTVLAAYPLAFARKTLKGRRFYVALILACMFFSGGTVPTYIMISRLGLIDNLFVLVLPGALSPWNLILFVNFFRNVPNEMLEAANIEGAGDYRILWRIVLPVSLPILATITLLCMVGHWNNWFDGYLYMDPEHWPLQTYIYDAMEKFKKLQNDIQHLDPEQIEQLAQSSDMTLRSAQIFIAMVPILCVYPFMQKYFVQGILIGSVKE